MATISLHLVTEPTLKRVQGLVLGALLTCVCSIVCAQRADIVITNARIADGTGARLDRGSIAIRKSRIIAVSETSVSAEKAMIIDVGGMFVMPGLIDVHQHLLLVSAADNEEALSRWMDEELARDLHELLAAGVTTIMSNGDHYPAILEIRERAQDDDLIGPKLLITGPFLVAPRGALPHNACAGNAWCRDHAALELGDSESARTVIRQLSRAGVDAIKVVDGSAMGHSHEGARWDHTVLATIMEEAAIAKLSVLVNEDARLEEALRLVALGAGRLAQLADTQVADRETFSAPTRPVATTLLSDAKIVNEHGVPRTPFGAQYGLAHAGRLDRKLADLRELWSHGVPIAFGTGSPPLIGAAEATRLETWILNRTFSAEDIVSTLTRHAAMYLGLADEIGVLAPGYVADLIVVDGDPLTDIADLRNVIMVIKDGNIVIDNR